MSIISSRLFPANGLSKYKREKVDPIKDALTHWITRTIQNGGRSIRLAVSIGRGIIINEHASRCSFAFISSLGILHGRHMAVERKGIGRKEVFQHDRIMFQRAYWEEEEDGRWRGRCAHVKAGTRWGHVPYILEERERELLLWKRRKRVSIVSHLDVHHRTLSFSRAWIRERHGLCGPTRIIARQQYGCILSYIFSRIISLVSVEKKRKF